MEIEEALKLYDFICPKYELIRHNENKTYHVIDSNKKEYLLRIHDSKKSFSLNILFNNDNLYNKIENELKSLIIMNNNGLSLQQPICTINNELVGKLSSGHLVSALTWIAGSDLGSSYNDYLLDIGKMMSLIHKSSTSINEYSIYYDCALINRMINVLNNDCLDEKISVENLIILIKTLYEIEDVISKLKTRKDHFGYIHSDLSLSNIIKTNNGIVPIDFSLGGFGYYEHEVGMMLCNINEIEDRRIIIQQYEKEMDLKLNCHDVDAFFCLSIILYIVIQRERLYKEENFSERIWKWHNNYFNKLINHIDFCY